MDVSLSRESNTKGIGRKRARQQRVPGTGPFLKGCAEWSDTVVGEPAGLSRGPLDQRLEYPLLGGILTPNI